MYTILPKSPPPHFDYFPLFAKFAGKETTTSKFHPAMKRAIIILTSVATIIGAAFTIFQRPTLFKNSKSNYAIVLCNDASTSEETAAKELQHYLQQISGTTLPIIGSDQLEDGQKHIFIGFNEKYGERCDTECPDSNDEGYTYRTIGKNIWIYGGKQ